MCRCGRPYETADGGGRYCPNCDLVQIREMMRMNRLRTRNDIKYDAYWRSVMTVEYPPLPSGVDEDWINGTGDNDDDE